MAPYQEELGGGGLGRGPGHRTSVTVPGVTGKMHNPRPRQKVIVQTKKVLHKQADRIAKQATEHEHLINKVTYCVGVVCFGIFCYLLGSRPQDIPYVYCGFFLVATPLRWIYYKSKKWHYFLLDFCYYANLLFTVQLLFFPTNQKFFLVCFAFSEGPLAWALIVWRCSLVFSSVDKIVSVLIHLLPGTTQFVIRWWDPVTFAHHSADETGPWPAWPPVETASTLWVYLFLVPLALYTLWQALYWLVVEVLRKQRMMKDPEVLTSYRELSRKASRANNVWWRLSGVLGDDNRVLMYGLLQAVFTVATMALAVPMFRSYRLHAAFQIFKIAMSIWQGGNFFFDVMPRQVHSKNEKKKALKNGTLGATAPAAGGGDPALPPGKPPTEADPVMAGVVLAERVEEEQPRGAGESERRELCSVCKQASLSNLEHERAAPAAAPDWLRTSKSEADLALPEDRGVSPDSILAGREEEEEDEEVWEEAAEGEEGSSGEESAHGPSGSGALRGASEAQGGGGAHSEGGVATVDAQGSKVAGGARDLLRRRNCASAVTVGPGYDRVACAS